MFDAEKMYIKKKDYFLKLCEYLKEADIGEIGKHLAYEIMYSKAYIERVLETSNSGSGSCLDTKTLNDMTDLFNMVLISANYDKNDKIPYDLIELTINKKYNGRKWVCLECVEKGIEVMKAKNRLDNTAFGDEGGWLANFDAYSEALSEYESNRV